MPFKVKHRTPEPQPSMLRLPRSSLLYTVLYISIAAGLLYNIISFFDMQS
jgi:hypothetical protein